MKNTNNVGIAYMAADVKTKVNETWNKSIIKVCEEGIKNKQISEKILHFLFNYKSHKTKYCEEMLENSLKELEHFEKNKSKIWTEYFFSELMSFENKRINDNDIYNLDTILEKISDKGFKSLTDEEINFLNNYTDTI